MDAGGCSLGDITLESLVEGANKEIKKSEISVDTSNISTQTELDDALKLVRQSDLTREAKKSVSENLETILNIRQIQQRKQSSDACNSEDYSP